MFKSSNTTEGSVIVDIYTSVVKILLIRGYNVDHTGLSMLTNESYQTKIEKILNEKSRILDFDIFDKTYKPDIKSTMLQYSQTLSKFEQFRFSKYLNRVDELKSTSIRVIIIAPNGSQPNVELVTALLNGEINSNIIIITQDKLTYKASDMIEKSAKSTQNVPTIWHFSYDDLINFPLDSSMYGNLKMYTNQDKINEICSYYESDLTKMPRFVINDIVVRIYGAQIGNLFTILRPSLDNHSLVDTIPQIRIVSQRVDYE